MSQSPRPTWIIDRSVARGRVRIGIAGWRFAAELNARRVALAHNDIASVQELAASRYTARQATQLRDGGYTHLLGGLIGLLPGEARILREVAMGTPEGLAIHRAKLVEALEQEADDDGEVEDVITGIGHHGDEHVLRVSSARQALLDFDREHPQVAAALVGRRDPGGSAS